MQKFPKIKLFFFLFFALTAMFSFVNFAQAAPGTVTDQLTDPCTGTPNCDPTNATVGTDTITFDYTLDANNDNIGADFTLEFGASTGAGSDEAATKVPGGDGAVTCAGGSDPVILDSNGPTVTNTSGCGTAAWNSSTLQVDWNSSSCSVGDSINVVWEIEFCSESAGNTYDFDTLCNKDGGAANCTMSEYVDEWGVDAAAPEPTFIEIKGNLYSDRGVTPDTGGGDVINMAVGTSTVGLYSTTTDSGSSVYKFENIGTSDIAIGTPILVWVDGNASKRAMILTKASSTSDGANITGLDLYKNRLTLRHEATSGTSTTNADLAFYDSSNDDSLRFTATAGGALEVFSELELHLWASSTATKITHRTVFEPGGAVTLHGSSSSAFGGNLYLGSTATNTTGTIFTTGSSSVMTLGGTLTMAGSLFASSTELAYASFENSTTTNSADVGESSPTGVTFKPDGRKMYVVGSEDLGNTFQVYHYNLSTPWDVSTASFENSTTTRSMGISELTLTDITFKPDGTKMYVVGDTNNKVYRYGLSTPWDITTTDFENSTTTNSSDVGEGSPTGVTFKPDGTKMYVTGVASSKVYRYGLSTPWDVSTASFENSTTTNSADVGESSPAGVVFKPDGTKMYVAGSGGDKVYRYNLSTPWDVTTASFENSITTNSADVGETSPSGVTLKPDGTKMYVVGTSGDKVYEYTLSPTLNSAGFGVFFNATTTGKSIYTPDVGEGFASTTFNGSGGGWTWQTPAYVDGNFTISQGTVTAPAEDLYLSGNYVNNGTFTHNSGTVRLSADGWNISGVTAGPDQSSGALSADEGGTSGLTFKSDGTAVYTIGTSNDKIHRYNLSTPWDISTVTAGPDQSSGALSTIETNPEGLTFSATGSAVYIIGIGSDKIIRYNLSTPWDISTVTAGSSHSSSSALTNDLDEPQDITFKSDGTAVYITGFNNNLFDSFIHRYDLSTPWDISTVATPSTASSSGLTDDEFIVQGLTFKSDGSSAYITGTDSTKIHRYDLSTPWDISTVATPADQSSGSLSADEGTPRGVTFKSDGSAVYIIGQTNDTIYRYDTASNNLSGTMTGSSAFNDLVLSGSVDKTINADATTVDFIIETTSGEVTAPSGTLSVAGDFTQDSTFTAGTGTTTFNGTSAQTISGTLVPPSAFYNVEITNSSATTTFSSVASTTNNFYAQTANAKVAFASGATTTLFNLLINGGSSSNEVRLWSDSSGTQWNLHSTGTRSVSFASIMDSDACSSAGNITASDSVDKGNNDCWTFAAASGASISSGNSQVFEINQSSSANSTITVTSTTAETVSATNDLRIAIATSTIDMLWLESDTSATLGGTGASKACLGASNCASITYEGGGSVMVVPIDTDFEDSETLTIADLKFTSFSSSSVASSVLDLYLDGSADTTSDADDDKTIAIKGKFVESNHFAGQEVNKFGSGSSVSNAELFSFKLTPTGENMDATEVIITLSDVRGFSSSDITNSALFIDYGADGGIDGTDDQVGGAGIVSISGDSGTITFGTSFTATTTRNYILRADVAGIIGSDEIKFGLDSEDISVTGASSVQTITVTGTVSKSFHINLKTLGGGGSIDTSPSGAGVETGGGEGGGEDIDPPPEGSGEGTGGGEGGGGDVFAPPKRNLASVLLAFLHSIQQLVF